MSRFQKANFDIKYFTQMKKILFSVLALSVSVLAVAQSSKTRLNLYGAYAFDDKVDSYYDANDYYNGTIEGGFLWGAGLEYMVKPVYGIELAYQRLNTNAPMTYKRPGTPGVQAANFDMGVNYITLGGNRYFPTAGRVAEPFFGAMLGVAVYSVDDPKDAVGKGTKTKFAWGLKGGSNIYLTPNIGLKLQAQLMSATQAVGGGLYFGTGGLGAGLSSFSSIMQFSLGGGLVYRMGATAAKPAAKPAPRPY
jgi:hypothetical protein